MDLTQSNQLLFLYCHHQIIFLSHCNLKNLLLIVGTLHSLLNECTAHTIFVSFWFSCMWHGTNAVLFTANLSCTPKKLNSTNVQAAEQSTQQVSFYKRLYWLNVIDNVNVAMHCSMHILSLSISLPIYSVNVKWTTSWALMGINQRLTSMKFLFCPRT